MIPKKAERLTTQRLSFLAAQRPVPNRAIAQVVKNSKRSRTLSAKNGPIKKPTFATNREVLEKMIARRL